MSNKELEGYVEIAIPGVAPGPIEVTLEDVTEESDQEDVEYDLKTKKETRTPAPQEPKQAANVTLEDDEEDEDQAEDEVDAEKAEQIRREMQKQREKERKPHQSRAQKRIIDLNNEKKELAAQLEQERNARIAAERNFKDSRKSSQEGMAASLKQQLSLLSAQSKEALTDGDMELFMSMQDQMMDVKMALRDLATGREADEPEAPVQRKAPAPQREQEPKVSDKAMSWVRDYPEFNTDPVFNGAALAVNRALLMEGYDANDEDFYEELNARLAPRFPEVFGIEEENDVEYSEKKKSTPSKADVKRQSPPRQTVSEASRSNAMSGKTRNKNTVRLSPEELKFAKDNGWTVEKMAKRKHHIEKNVDPDGYVSILMRD